MRTLRDRPRSSRRRRPVRAIPTRSSTSPTSRPSTPPTACARTSGWPHNIVNDFAPSTAGRTDARRGRVRHRELVAAGAEHQRRGQEPRLQRRRRHRLLQRATSAPRSRSTRTASATTRSSRTVKQGLTVYDTDSTRPPKMVLADGEMRAAIARHRRRRRVRELPVVGQLHLLVARARHPRRVAEPGHRLRPAPELRVHQGHHARLSAAEPHNPSGCVTPAHGGTCRNGEYRYGMASALLVRRRRTRTTTRRASPIRNRWDEEATINQSTTGLTPGYLGQPLGRRSARRATRPANLTINPSFETDLTAVTSASVVPARVTVTRDTTTAAPGVGSASLRADVTGADRQTRTAADARVFTDVTGALDRRASTRSTSGPRRVNNAAGPQALDIGVGLDGRRRRTHRSSCSRTTGRTTTCRSTRRPRSPKNADAQVLARAADRQLLARRRERCTAAPPAS